MVNERTLFAVRTLAQLRLATSVQSVVSGRGSRFRCKCRAKQAANPTCGSYRRPGQQPQIGVLKSVKSFSSEQNLTRDSPLVEEITERQE
jgi:hypothetical protein